MFLLSSLASRGASLHGGWPTSSGGCRPSCSARETFGRIIAPGHSRSAAGPSNRVAVAATAGGGRERLPFGPRVRSEGAAKATLIPESLPPQAHPPAGVAPAPGGAHWPWTSNLEPEIANPSPPGARGTSGPSSGWEDETPVEMARPAPPVSFALSIAVWRTTTHLLHFRCQESDRSGH